MNKIQTLVTPAKAAALKVQRVHAAKPTTTSAAKERLQRREALAKLKEIESRAIKVSKAARAISERLA